ncbi:TonB-dependent receptor plug domain-containing protein [Sulfurimonas aquatica]|nr:TonB-dependent receptor [Sulfurimonas aquatica]
MKKALLLSSLLYSLYAENTDSLIESLQGDLTKYMQIATQTKENVDYMPYVISVLKNADLEKLGILTLREAITLLPGVDISIGMAGVQNPIFRGSNPLAMGQSKLIIDGVVVNDNMFGAYYQYLDMPIDIIERIEVVRGPGSLQSNVNAYAGSIHVITKANKNDGEENENSIFAAIGSNDYKMGGFVGAYKEESFKLSGDLFYQEHDKTLPIGPDRMPDPATSPDPTSLPLWLKNYSLGLNFEYKDFYIKGRLAKNESGVSSGQAFSLTRNDTDFLNVDNNFLEAGYSTNITNDIKVKLSLNYFDETRSLQNNVMPNGTHFLVDYSEKTLKQNLEFTISSFENQTITSGIVLSQASILNNNAELSPDILLDNSTPLLSNSKRDSQSFYIDDLINFNEKTSLQLSLKYDMYSDVDDQISPRVAIVHRHNDENIFKLMYTHSYREPSWREQYLAVNGYFGATLDMKPEVVDAYEAAYIRKFSESSNFKLNLFYLSNLDQINAQNTMRTFMNSGDNELYGLETEFRASILEDDSIYLNYSYVDGHNTHDSLANSAHHMAKAYYIYTISDNLSASTIVKYIGEKDRITVDNRDKLDEYFIADLSATYKYKPSDILFSVSVKNLFNEKYYLPAPENTYQGDFQQAGRSFLVRASKRF